MAKKRDSKKAKGTEKVGTPELNTIAGYDKDIINKAHQGLLKPQDATLATRGSGKGLAIYDDIERDCHAYAVLQKRKLAVVSFPWEIDAATDDASDVKAADGIREMLDAADIDGLTMGLLDAILKGYAVSEVEWDPETWTPVKFHMRDQRRFVFDEECRPRLLTPDNRQEGEELPERKFIIHQFGAKDGNPYGLGLGTRLFWPALFKRQGLAFWLVFAEKFGGPTVLGKYPMHMTEAAREELKVVLGRTSQETAIVAPVETEIELLDVAKSGSIDTYDRLLRYMDEEMSKAVLGETLTTTIGDVGSRAAAQTHNGVRMELIKADADLLSVTLNKSLLTWLTEWHFPGANPPRMWRRVEEPKDEKAEADKDLVIFQMGFAPEEEFIQKKYGDGWKRRAMAPQDGGWDMDGTGQAPDATTPEGTGEDAPVGGAVPNLPEQTAPNGAQSDLILQDTALNGAQWSSMLDSLKLAAVGVLPKETIFHAIKAACPSVPDERISGMLNPIVVKEPGPVPEPAATPEPKAEFAEHRNIHKPLERGSIRRDAVDAMTDQLEYKSVKAMDALLEPVKRLVENAASFDEVLGGLAEAYPDMDDGAFKALLGEAMMAAHLAGAAAAKERIRLGHGNRTGDRKANA